MPHGVRRGRTVRIVGYLVWNLFLIQGLPLFILGAVNHNRTLEIIGVALLAVFARTGWLAAMFWGGGATGRRRAGGPGPDYAAMSEIESHDIDDMLDGINERRRRAGRRDVGEELADEFRRGTWDGD